MGTEIVFVLILPIMALCLTVAVLRWSPVAKGRVVGGKRALKAYVPLLAGFTVSMASLAVLTYLACDADFTALVEQGYYTEAQRPVYLPRRVVGQATVELVFLLPIIAFLVIPLTISLIKRDRLSVKEIGYRGLVAWLLLSGIGWVFSHTVVTPPYSFLSFLQSTAVPVLLYGLPIPLAALWFFSPEHRV